MKTSLFPSPFKSPTWIAPSLPQSPVHVWVMKSVPVDKLTSHVLSESRHRIASAFPSPLKSPTNGADVADAACSVRSEPSDVAPSLHAAKASTFAIMKNDEPDRD